MQTRRRVRGLGLLMAVLMPLALTLPTAPVDAAPGDCPGNKKSCTKNDKKKPKPPPDTQAPPAPSLGAIVVLPKGKVELPVLAEAKARVVVVDEEQGQVAKTKATGQSQVLTWRAGNGPHTYSVTATDKADNQSVASTVSVVVDAKPPRLKRFVTKAGTSTDPRSRITFATEQGASFEILVDGNTIGQGTTGAKPVKKVLDIENGRHRVRVRLSDETGNRTSATKQLAVRVSGLFVDAQLTSDATTRTQVVAVIAPRGAQGTLSVPGLDDVKFKARGKAAKVKLEVPDGSYRKATVSVESAGRTGSDVLPDFEVDTTPPEVAVDVDALAAEQGRLVMDIEAEDAAEIEWILVDQAGKTVSAGGYVADGGTTRTERDVPEGSYQLQVTAQDRYGRTTLAETEAGIAADPIASWVWALIGLAVLALLVLAAFLGRLLVRRRRYARAHSEPLPANGTGRRAVAKTRAAYTRSLVSYELAAEQWQQRNAALTTLLAVAQGEDNPTLAAEGFDLLPDERVLYSTPARLTELVEDGSAQVPIELDAGTLVVTTQRFSFIGEQQRDWWCALVARVRHLDHESSTIMLRGLRSTMGVTYADPDVTRLYLDLALAEQNGTTPTFLSGVAQGLRNHELRRPTPPSASQAQTTES